MEFAEAGYFSKTHGVKGALVLKPLCDLATDDLKAVFVESGGSKAPYFIEELKEINGGLILHLEGCNTVENAKKLINKKVFIAADLVLPDEEEDLEWVGYELIDSEKGSLGKVENVTDNGVQVLLTLTYNTKEIILPLVEEFIVKTDAEARKIWYKAPAGLIDLYLETGAE